MAHKAPSQGMSASVSARKKSRSFTTANGTVKTIGQPRNSSVPVHDPLCDVCGQSSDDVGTLAAEAAATIPAKNSGLACCSSCHMLLVQQRVCYFDCCTCRNV